MQLFVDGVRYRATDINVHEVISSLKFVVEGSREYLLRACLLKKQVCFDTVCCSVNLAFYIYLCNAVSVGRVY